MIVRHSKPIDPAPPGRPCPVREYRTGSTFVLVMVGMVVLMTLGLGMLTVAWGARHRAVMLKSEATAMLAAEAHLGTASLEPPAPLPLRTADAIIA